MSYEAIDKKDTSHMPFDKKSSVNKPEFTKKKHRKWEYNGAYKTFFGEKISTALKNTLYSIIIKKSRDIFQ